MSETTYYAIGDVHGEADMLERLLEDIRFDAQRLGLAHKIIFLGDLIDRGPDSRSIVVRAMELETSGEAASIKGNHEELMLHAYDREETIGLYHWANNGGDETIASYERINGKQDHWRKAIDATHITFLRALPTMIRDEARGLAFVHGGIDPRTFPDCSDDLRMWTRSHKFFDPGRWPDRPELARLQVIHGHTPTHDFQPHVNPRRINVDTGACFGGPLTAVALAPGEAPRFLHAWRR